MNFSPTNTSALRPETSSLIIVVMGVSGCGKSTVAQFITDALEKKGHKVHGRDGDELHPKSNIDKMASGIALTDEDRQPWLEDLADYARQQAQIHDICVIACSALKRRYRDTLNSAGNVVYIYLQGSHSLIASRMHARTGHFMPERLLDSQFAALEDPRGEAHVVSVSVEPAPDVVALHAIELLEQQRYINAVEHGK